MLMKKSDNAQANISGVLKFIRNRIVLFIPEKSPVFRYLALIAFRINAINRHKKLKILKIDIPVVEHCNLCCRGCTAFSPLAKEEFLDFDEYCRDMQKLAELSNHKLSSVTYTGGEPLLHPRFKDMLQYARVLFPKAEIDFMTNGTLIPKQADEFWKTCADNKVSVRISKYPIKLDEGKIAEIQKTWKIKFDWVGGKDVPVKKMWKYPLDLSGGYL